LRDGAEKRPFLHHFYTKKDHFAKTGSGQAARTAETKKKRRRFCRVDSNRIPVRKTPLFFWSFPYVCPEPVLVKSLFKFLYQKDRQATENASFEPPLMLKPIDSPRQARDERRESCEKRCVVCRRAVRWTRRRLNTTSGWACRCCCSSYQKMVRNLNRLFWAHDFLLKHDDL
jgi:hypothetical protein